MPATLVRNQQDMRTYPKEVLQLVSKENNKAPYTDSLPWKVHQPIEERPSA